MICITERYFRFNRIILLAVGIWPYQQSKIVQLQFILFLGTLISFIAFELSRLLFAERTFDFAIRILCSSSYFTFLAIKYISFSINVKNMRYLLEWLQYIYNNLKDKNEIAIYDKYGNIAKRITIMFIISALCCLLIIIILQTWSHISDVIAPKNESYSYQLKIVLCRYFAIQEKYFYIILIHVNMAIIIGSIALLAAGTMILAYFKHICGIFRIASYRFDQAMTINTLGILKNEIVYYYIIGAIDIHRKAMMFAKLLKSSMQKSLFFLVIITVLCVTFNLYAISVTESFIGKIEETVTYLLVLIFILIYMFLVNYIGQEFMDYNNHIFLIAYNVPWYRTPLHIQKLILFLLQRGSKAFTWNIGGIFSLSLECFASLASTSISYFTVMLSLK